MSVTAYQANVAFSAVERDDTVCLEVEVESSEAPYGGVQNTEDHYEEDVSGEAFETEPYEEVVPAGYQHSSVLTYNS